MTRLHVRFRHFLMTNLGLAEYGVRRNAPIGCSYHVPDLCPIAYVQKNDYLCTSNRNAMDIVLIILGALCLLLGIVGCVAPVLPGVPLAYIGLLLLQPTDRVQFTWQFLVIWAAIVVVVQLLDYFIPAWGTKRFGGSKWGVWGSTIGLFVGLFVGPWGIVIGPFAGAVIGELLYLSRHNSGATSTTPLRQALRAGMGSFIGLLTGTVIKLICCGMMAYYFIAVLV